MGNWPGCSNLALGLLGTSFGLGESMYRQQHALYSDQQYDWARQFLAVGTVQGYTSGGTEEFIPDKKIASPKLNEEVALCSKHLWSEV